MENNDNNEEDSREKELSNDTDTPETGTNTKRSNIFSSAISSEVHEIAMERDFSKSAIVSFFYKIS